jgi:hypothetical protein
MSKLAFPFTSGKSIDNQLPLARYLPPIPDSMLGSWMQQNIPSGNWIIDPFCASPISTIEAARAGYRVLVAANNPIARFLLELFANPPDASEVNAALADISIAYKGEDRLEPMIRSLYQTTCHQCGEVVTAEAFLWERGKPAPFGKLVNCPKCGRLPEHMVTQADVNLANRFSGAAGLHRARALERVAAPDDPDRAHVEEALETYLPRAIYAIFNVINKLESLPPARRRLHHVLLISAFDQTNTLWQFPTVRARPRQLTVPPRFRENNLWLALEEAANYWSQLSKENLPVIPIKTWPDTQLPPSGICLYEGRIKDLAELLNDLPIEAAAAVLPRPNQAFWTLSALWTGWLWGRDASSPLKSVLRRRRYDWAWHCGALYAAFSSLTSKLKTGSIVFGIIAEVEAGFLSAALLSAHLSNLELRGIAYRAEDELAQILWECKATTPRKGIRSIEEYASADGIDRLIEKTQPAIQLAGRHYLLARGEPADFLQLQAAALFDVLTNEKMNLVEGIPPDRSINPVEAMAHFQPTIHQAFTYRSGFYRFGGSEHSIEIGQWWLKDSLDSEIPFSDRVEVEVVRQLQRKPSISVEAMDKNICMIFDGLLTPDLELIRNILISYGEQESQESLGWQLRPADTPQARRADLLAMHALVRKIADQLGYEFVERKEIPQKSVAGFREPLIWQDTTGKVVYAFYLVASAVIGRILSNPAYSPHKTVLIYPGSRASLIAYKIRNNPLLKQTLEGGYHLIKFRHLRRLSENAQLNRLNIDALLDEDPLGNSDPQMTLL